MANCGADRHRGREANPLNASGVEAESFGVFDHHNGVAPLGQRRPGHDPYRLTGPNRAIGSCTGGDLADHDQFDWLLSSGGNVRGLYRGPVNRGVVERRNDLGGDHRSRYHEASGIEARDLDRHLGRARPEHEFLRIFQRRHDPTVPSEPDVDSPEASVHFSTRPDTRAPP